MKSNLRQPGDTTNISDNYQDHLDRGSQGGDDLTDRYGTLVRAQLDGCYVSIVDNSPDGSGGRYIRLTGPDGDSVESLHQSSVTAARGSWWDAEGVVGRSGASAFGSDYGTGGPHIHNHGVHANGVRFNLEPYYWWLNGGSTTAGGNVTPIPLEGDAELMALSDPVKGDIETIHRDQEKALWEKDEAFKASVRARVSEAIADEVKSIVDNINTHIAAAVATELQGFKNMLTRERWQFASVAGRSDRWAINMSNGTFTHYTGLNDPLLARDIKKEKVSSLEDASGKRVPEPPMEFESIAALNDFLVSLRADPTELAV
jgi:hypothetical protein